MKRKVLHIINALTPDGAENLLVNSLSAGGLQGYTDNLLVYLQATSPIVERVDKDVKVICLDYKGIFDLPRILLKIRKIIKEHQVDIVHSHLNPVSFYTYLSCPRSVPQVHTIHTTYSMDTQTSRVKLFLERVLYFTKKSCNLIFLTDYTRGDFLRVVKFKGKAFVLNNFIHDNYFKDSAKVYNDTGQLKMVAVGRLTPLKNFEFLLEAFGYLKDKNICLDIYGAGDIEKFERKVKEAGIKVKMMGHHFTLENELTKYDLFIMPSKYEGFGLVIFEAMASGVPVMVSDIAPLRSIVKDNAIYFDLNDAKAVADKIAAVAEKKIDINAMAVKAQDHARKTATRDMYIKKLLEIYDQVFVNETVPAFQ